ncbi:hypothetical protein SSP35_23_00840 [Streptomyces sp. NBRC 110611]|nr:hypothetical protein SSP35_23_00840 [Streptomyces sp. NBRC 110611]
MPVAVVHVVDVIAMGHRDVAAAFPVRVVVTGVLFVAARFALVHMVLVAPVQMAVVHVVDVIAVRDCYMAAALAVRVVMSGVGLVFGCCRHAAHLRGSCRRPSRSATAGHGLGFLIPAPFREVAIPAEYRQKMNFPVS